MFSVRQLENNKGACFIDAIRYGEERLGAAFIRDMGFKKFTVEEGAFGAWCLKIED